MSGSHGSVSIGGNSASAPAGRSNEPHRPDVDSKTLGESKTPSPTPAGEGDDATRYGEEGTNKTLPEPKPDDAPSDEPGHTRHIPKSPYTRG